MDKLLLIGELVLAIFIGAAWLRIEELMQDVRELRGLFQINASAGRAMRRINSQRIRAEEQLRRIDEGW